MSRTSCEHCNALATPGASFCLTCFIPFEDEAPAPVVQVPVAVPMDAPVPVAVGAPAAGPNDFFAPAAPPQFMHHPGENVDWRATAPVAAMLAPTPHKPKSVVPKVVAGVVALLVLVGAVFGAKALLGRPSEKQEMATAFREARPPDLFPVFPGIGSLLGGTESEPEAPGAAQAFVQMIDPKIQAANEALLGMQDTMDRWADGKLSDDALRTEIREFNAVLDDATGIETTAGAPSSLQRGIGKLTESAIEYRMALGALLDWLDSQTNGARLTYRLTIGDANLHWDEGLINLYRAAGLKTPPLPHPQPKKK